MPSFSTTLEHSIHAALALANDRSHEFATLEHLLLSLLDEPDAIRVLRACDVDLDELRGNLVEFIEGDLASLVTDVEGSEAVPTAAAILVWAAVVVGCWPPAEGCVGRSLRARCRRVVASGCPAEGSP